MNKSNALILLFVLYSLSELSGQKIFTADLKKIHTYTLGYQMPILTKPDFQYAHGYTVGFEYIIKYKEKNRENARHKFTGTDRHFFLNNAMGGYYDLDSANSLYLHTQIARRITWRPGFKLEGLAGIGYLRRYPNQHYVQGKTPFYTNLKENGKGYFMPSIALGVGWDFYRCCKVPISLNIRPGMYFQLPSEKPYKPYYNIEGSVSVSFYKKKEKTMRERVKDIFTRKKKNKK